MRLSNSKAVSLFRRKAAKWWVQICLCGILAMGVRTAFGEQVILDFESTPIPLFSDYADVAVPYHEDGFLIGAPEGECESLGFHVCQPWPGGSKTLQATGDRQFWVIAQETNGTFDLVSFDMALVDDNNNGIYTFDMLGIRRNGTVARDTVTFTHQGIFRTIQPVGFTELIAFVVSNRGEGDGPARLDNIVLDNIHHGVGFATGQTTLDFEELSPPDPYGQNDYGRLYYKDGYMLADANGDTETVFRALGAGATGYPTSNAINLTDVSGENSPHFCISRLDRKPFWIKSVDVAALAPFQYVPVHIRFADRLFLHTEPNPESSTPTFVTYLIGMKADPCLRTGGLLDVQLDNIRLIEPPPVCAADFNGDTFRDVADLFAYINAWLAKSSAADFNNDAAVDVADLFGYINAWLVGCPQ